MAEFKSRVALEAIRGELTLAELASKHGGHQTMKDVMHDLMAIKRHATGAEIAGLVAYLAGPEAGIITGTAYNIDGGFAA